MDSYQSNFSENYDSDVTPEVTEMRNTVLADAADWFQAQFPARNPVPIDVESKAVFLGFLRTFMLEHLDGDVGPVFNRKLKQPEDRERPGFLEVFRKDKVNLAHLKKTYDEIREQAEALGENTTQSHAVTTWIKEICNQIFLEVNGLEGELRREALIQAIDDAFDGINLRLHAIAIFQLFEMTRSVCSYEAIYDLISGKLNRLDPVIGDYGCQWRTPFLLDLHDAVQEYLKDWYHDDPDFIAEALKQFEICRQPLGAWPEILTIFERGDTTKERVDTGRTKNNKPVTERRVLHKDPRVWRLYQEMGAFCDNLCVRAPAFWELICELKSFFDTWMADHIPGFNALEYLHLCKLFTVNRVRTLDQFGLSGVPGQIPLPGGEDHLSTHLMTLSNHSMAYMTYVCQEACIMQGLTLDENGYAYDPLDREKVSIMGSALRLMKDARVWTLQQGKQFQVNMCYGPTRAIFTRQALRGQPIIIDLRRLICEPDDAAEGEYRFRYNGGAILYYEPNEHGVFRHVPDHKLRDDQRSRVGLVCEACSVVLVDGPVPDDADAVFCSQNFDEYLGALQTIPIVDLIMFGLSSHPEVTTQIRKPDEEQPGKYIALSKEETKELTDRYNMEASGRGEMPEVDRPWVLMTDRIPFPDVTGPDWDLLLEKVHLLSALPKLGCTTSQYKKRLPENKAKRNPQTMPFAPIHIFGSTYEAKVAELNEAEAYMNQNDIDGAHRIIYEHQCRPRHDQ